MRKVTIATALTVVVAVVAALLTDTGLAIRAEHRFAVALRTGAHLSFDPEVTIGGFPFVNAMHDKRFDKVGITARGVDLGRCGALRCRGDLRSSLSGVRPSTGWLVRPDSRLAVSSASGSVKIDSVALGRFLDIRDLTVTTPAPRNKAGSGGPQDGILSASHDILLTGTVDVPAEAGRPTHRTMVSVSADLSVVAGALRVHATRFYRGPEEHSEADIPASVGAKVLAEFTRTLPVLPLPWGIAATRAHTEGSDVTIAGADLGPSTLVPADFDRSAPRTSG